MADVPMPAAMARTPAGQRLAFMLHHLRTAGQELTDDLVNENLITETTSAEDHRARLQELGAKLVGSEVREYRAPGPQIAIALVGHGDRAWHVGVKVENQPPYLARGAIVGEVLPGVQVRRAGEQDASDLREIELAAPIMVGDTSITYDRGEDYFAAERLMGDVVTLVIERGGVPIGLTSTIVNKIRANGQDLIGNYRHRLRLLPEARGQGIRQMLGMADFENNAWRGDLPYSFVAADNEAMLRNVRGSRRNLKVERAVIDTAQCAGQPHGRQATAADWARIVALLNSAHEGEELFVPYTEQTLAARLEREPDLYSWRNFRVSDRAVAGVWPARLRVIRETTGGRSEDIRALVLDYGYEPGAEDELVTLLRAACAELADGGTTELSIFTSAPSSTYSHLAMLAKRMEPYVLFLAVQEPGDLDTRGIYVDQLYF